MLFLNAKDVRAALPISQAITAMKAAYAAFSGGRALIPQRIHLPVKHYQGISLFMPAFVEDREGDALAVKVVSVFPKNVSRNIPIIQGAVLVLEPSTGIPLALLEGSTLTSLRTGAASGAATDILADQNASSVSIFGAGIQGRTQLKAVCAVRPIQTAWVYDPDPRAVELFISEMRAKDSVPEDIRMAESPEQAASASDIICTATSAYSPVFKHSSLSSGCHINAIGSYLPEMQEIPTETVSSALVVVDSVEAALSETGDLIQPIKEGVFAKEKIHAELGEIILGKKTGRTSIEQVTLFKSVGLAVQDAMAAKTVLKNAAEIGLGQEVNW